MADKHFIKIPLAIINAAPNQLTDSEKLLWISFASHADSNGKSWASADLHRRKLGWGRNKFFRTKKGLLDKGYISTFQDRVEDRPKGYRNTNNGYTTSTVTIYEDPSLNPHNKPPTYSEYIRSDEWKEKRKKAIKAADGKCQLCGSTTRINVHHRTYERLGKEKPSDLTVLCESCHYNFHQNGGLA